jgi:large subunit ribosomal protein L6
MSRIGRLPVKIPAGVDAQIDADGIRIKGPRGSLAMSLPTHVSAAREGDAIVLRRDAEHGVARGNHGLSRANLQNLVTGVTKGFEKKLSIIGVGFRAEVKAGKLVMQLGYSHPIEYPVPKGMAIDVDKAGTIVITGADRQQVGQVAAEIRSFRKPDSYKGKGVRYIDERPRIKAGKQA